MSTVLITLTAMHDEVMLCVTPAAAASFFFFFNFYLFIWLLSVLVVACGI